MSVQPFSVSRSESRAAQTDCFKYAHQICPTSRSKMGESYDPTYTWSLHFEVDVKIGILKVVGSTYLQTVKAHASRAARAASEYEMMSMNTQQRKLPHVISCSPKHDRHRT